jgi:hypothetical protein
LPTRYIVAARATFLGSPDSESGTALNTTCLDVALLLNFKQSKLAWKGVLRG